jgi:Secretion system C-terminal sorting domain
VKSLNIFTNFEQGVRSLDSKIDMLYVVEGNDFSSNYSFLNTDVDLNLKGTAIYLSATAAVTPYKLSIKENNISKSLLGIYVSRFSPTNTLANLALFGPECEILGNTIKLFKPTGNLLGTHYKNKAIVLFDNKYLDVVKNTLLTDQTQFNDLLDTDKDLYAGIEMELQNNGCDFLSNTMTSFGAMMSIKGNNDGSQLKCNTFNNITAYANATGFDFIATASMLEQGTATDPAGNKWINFSITNRVRGSVDDPIPYNYTNVNNQNPNNNIQLQSFQRTDAPTCNPFQGFAVSSNDEEEGNHTNDLAKDGEIDTLSVLSYEPIYDSTSTVTDLYSDAYYLQLALEAAAEGLIDSNAVAENFINSVVYDVYLLETAIAMGDSAAIADAATNMPHDDMGDNYTFVATLLAASEPWSTEDSAQVWSTAFQKISDGGPAVIIARNMLGIYVDDSTLEPKSNKTKNQTNTGTFMNIAPNPNSGKFVLTTNIPLQSSIKIFDSFGRLLLESILTNFTTELNLENLQNGLYHLAINYTFGKLSSTSFIISK